MQANKLDRNFIYSWIGSGHANAIEDKSDQVLFVTNLTKGHVNL